MGFASNLSKAFQQHVGMAIGVWGTFVLAGFAVLTVYSFTPGVIAAPPPWNLTSLPFSLPDDQYVLVMGMHPKCPCTRASLGELQRLLRYAEGKLACHVLAYQPPNATVEWQQTDLITAVLELPHTKLHLDAEGHMASQLSIATSGAIVLYTPDGRPVFHGGITAGRSHHGDNLGSEAILALLADEQPDTRQTPVYGCPIRGEADLCPAPGASCCEGIAR